MRRRAAAILAACAARHTRSFHSSLPAFGRRALKNRDRKERTSLAKARVFGRVGAAVRAAVRSGGADPVTNAALRDAIAAAKAAAVPLSIVQRNIERSARGGGDDDVTLGIVASGLGPHNQAVSLLIQANTDSIPRLTADVRAVTNKAKPVAARLVGSGASAAAGLGFKRVAVVVVQVSDGRVDEDGIVAAAADAGADDVVALDDPPNTWRVTGPPEAYGALRDALSTLPSTTINTADSGLEYVATATVGGVGADARAGLDALVDALLAVDGVDAVWSGVVEEEEEEE